MKFILFFLLSIFTNSMFSQSGDITIKDTESNDVISEATVIFTNLSTHKKQYSSSDINGNISNSVSSKSLLTIIFTGYKTINDTIQPNDSKEYHLELDVFHLDQVVVTSTRTEKALKNAPVLTQIISSKQIEARGFQNVTDVLTADIPGLEIQQHGYGTNINAQGLKPVNILVLVDGERLAGETRGNIDYSRLNTQDIDRIEIVKGASSALYGSQAMGAVINIITKKSSKKFYATASSQYTSRYERNYTNLIEERDDYIHRSNLDKHNLTQNYSIGFNLGKWKSKTNFTHKTKDAYVLQDSKALANHFTELDTITYENKGKTRVDGIKDFTINQSIRFKASKKLKVYAAISYYDHNQYDHIYDNVHDKYKDFNYTIKTTYTPNSKSTLVFSWHDDSYSKYNYFEILDSLSENYKHHYINPKMNASHQVNLKHHLTGGIEFLNETLLSDQFSMNRSLINKSISNSVIYLQDDFEISEKWNSVLGVRAEYHNSFGMHYSPKLSLMYKNYPFTVRTNLASGYRSPNVKELFSDWKIPVSGLTIIIKGEENLQPETNKYISSSLEYSKSKINTSATVYYNAFKDKIEIVSADQETYTYQNTQNSTLFGIDYNIHFQPTKSWFLKAAYSYVKESKDEGERLSSASPHTGSLQLGYNYSRKNYKLTTSLTGKYLGSKEAYGIKTIEYRDELVESIYNNHYDAYSIWRLSIQQKFKKYITVNVGFNNLFNYQPQTITFNTSITPGRSYFLGVKLNLEQLLF